MVTPRSGRPARAIRSHAPPARVAIALACAAVLAFGARSAAADEPPPENVILADLGLHVVGLGYQRTIAPWLAWQIALDGYVPWTQNIGAAGDERRSDLFGAVMRQRLFFYALGSAPDGLWISPFAQYGIGWATRDDTRITGSLGAAGLSLGYAGTVGPGVHLSIGAGGQYHAAYFPGAAGTPSFGLFYPTVDASIGYAF